MSTRIRRTRRGRRTLAQLETVTKAQASDDGKAKKTTAKKAT